MTQLDKTNQFISANVKNNIKLKHFENSPLNAKKLINELTLSNTQRSDKTYKLEKDEERHREFNNKLKTIKQQLQNQGIGQYQSSLDPY